MTEPGWGNPAVVSWLLLDHCSFKIQDSVFPTRRPGGRIVPSLGLSLHYESATL